MEQTKKTKTKSILYRVVPMVCAIVITLFSLFPLKADAADFYYDTFVTSSGQILGSSYFNMTFPSSYIRLTAYDLYSGSNITTSAGSFNIGFGYGQMQLRSAPSGGSYYSYNGYFITRPFGSNYLRLSDVPVGSQLVYTFDHYLNIDYPSDMYLSDLYRSGTVTGYVAVRYYDSHRNNVATDRVSATFVKSFKDGNAHFNQLYLNENVTVTMNYPDNATYFQVWAYVTFDGTWNSGISPGFELTVKNNVSQLLIADKNASPEIIDQMVDLNNKNQTIIDQNQQLINQGNTHTNQNNQIIANQEDLINGTSGAQSSVNQSVDRLEGSASDMEQLTQDMIVEKPDPDFIDVAVDDLLPDNSMNIITQPILKLWDNPLLYSMIVVILTLVMISWVMFGKKG